MFIQYIKLMQTLKVCALKLSNRFSYVVSNMLQLKFNPMNVDKAWATDITNIQTHEKWIYFVVELLSCKATW